MTSFPPRHSDTERSEVEESALSELKWNEGVGMEVQGGNEVGSFVARAPQDDEWGVGADRKVGMGGVLRPSGSG